MPSLFAAPQGSGTGYTAPEPEYTTLTVNKVWEGDDEIERPAAVTVQLYRDGEPTATATLSEDTGWTYTWTELDANSAWTVGEIDIPEGYEAEITVSEDGTTVTIVNTYEVEVPDEPPPLVPPPEPEIPEIDIPEDPVPLASPPKTGDSFSDFWYVLTVLSAAGLMALKAEERKKREEN